MYSCNNKLLLKWEAFFEKVKTFVAKLDKETDELSLLLEQDLSEGNILTFQTKVLQVTVML